MAIISGQDAKLQIGKETTWGTGVAPTVQLPFINEDIKTVKSYIYEDSLSGNVTDARADIAGEKVEGSFTTLLKPDAIGLLLSAALGAESAAVAAEATSTVYDHTFSCVVGGSANSLPKLTIVVDRQAAVKGYVSSKINSMSLEAAVNDYVRGTFGIRGRNEQSDAVESLSNSTKVPFMFIHGNITLDDAAFGGVTSFKLELNNNLEDNLFTMDSSSYMEEIEPQKREITMEIEALFDADNETIRSSKFMAGSTADIDLVFTSTETAGASLPYSLTITCPLCYVVDHNPVVTGPERIKVTMSLKATQDDSNQPLTIVLRDLQGTKYIT